MHILKGRFGPVERRVKTDNLRGIRESLRCAVNASQIVGLVQGCQRLQRGQLSEDRFCDKRRRTPLRAPMHHPVPNPDDGAPVQQGHQGCKDSAGCGPVIGCGNFRFCLALRRLQRQDRVLEEAALDLGASSFFMFRRITLPFLAPTIVTAAVIAFLQSIENYNTTVFAIGGDWTLVTEIGSRFRFGLSPVINVIGVLFVLVTVLAATVYTIQKERERKRKAAMK